MSIVRDIALIVAGIVIGVSIVLYLKRKKVVKNKEVWEWIDYKGRKRRLIVKREVHG